MNEGFGLLEGDYSTSTIKCQEEFKKRAHEKGGANMVENNVVTCGLNEFMGFERKECPQITTSFDRLHRLGIRNRHRGDVRALPRLNSYSSGKRIDFY